MAGNAKKILEMDLVTHMTWQLLWAATYCSVSVLQPFKAGF